MTTERNFTPYHVVLNIENEEESYSLFEALRHYSRYLSSQNRSTQTEAQSLCRLISMVDTAWTRSANTTTDND